MLSIFVRWFLNRVCLDDRLFYRSIPGCGIHQSERSKAYFLSLLQLSTLRSYRFQPCLKYFLVFVEWIVQHLRCVIRKIYCIFIVNLLLVSLHFVSYCFFPAFFFIYSPILISELNRSEKFNQKTHVKEAFLWIYCFQNIFRYEFWIFSLWICLHNEEIVSKSKLQSQQL